jgi:hypothetical protein
MKFISPDILPNHPADSMPEEIFSFLPLYQFLIARKDEERVVVREIYLALIKELDRRPDLMGNIDISSEPFQKDSLILDMIYAITSNIVHATEDNLWALALPLSIGPFYGTDFIAKLIINKKNNICNLEEQEEPEHDIRRISFMYATILEKIYLYKSVLSNSLVLKLFNKDTNVNEYYEAKIDTSFLNVIAKQNLPRPDLNKVEQLNTDEDLIGYLTSVIPLDLFRFEGFNVLTLTDITEQHALSIIKNTILIMDEESKDICEQDISDALHTLAKTSLLNFSLIPLIILNDKPVFDFGEMAKTLISPLLDSVDPLLEEEVYQFMHHPEPLLISDVSAIDNVNVSPFLKTVLEKTGVESIALMPLFYNKQLIGVIEISSKIKGALTETEMRNLKPAFPFLSQLLKYAVEAINNKISLVVNEKFTAIQTAVAWKFNEAAWAYLKNKPTDQSRVEIEPVLFTHLYPLYGAIDIRNSSIERNKALKQDLDFQLNLLSDTLAVLKADLNLSILDEVSYRIGKWIAVQDNTHAGEHLISQYLESEVTPFMEHVSSQYPGSKAAINIYMEAIDPVQGYAYKHRRELEESMEMITKTISLYLDLMNQEMQKAYPCYFDKFRTDGIEYDIYIGQSIRPNVPFDMMYLKNLRFMQLSSMAGIYKQLFSMLPQMPHRLQTTQLIYVNSDPIDISFRMDEKRFDVEGGYNIRYQMIKKRIDKVHVRDTGERLTQPGTIAIVYSGNADVKEYVSYIDYLRECRILAGDIEFLQLEELQGVGGLRALRIAIDVEEQETGHEQ